MNRSSILPVAAACFFAISGCDLAEQNADSPTRSFAPRITSIPMSKFVRLEVAEVSLENLPAGNKPTGFYIENKVLHSSGKIEISGIPSDRQMFFRLSGLDSNQAPIWVTSSGIPDGATPRVYVGFGTSYVPKTYTPPSITATSSSSALMINCTGGGSPAWTIDGTDPTPDNSTSTRFTGNGTQTNVSLTSDQKLTARCTDRVLWSTSSTYKITGPTNPTPIGEGANFPAPSIGIPTLSTGNLSFTANTGFYPNYSNWKIVYQISSSPSSWNVVDYGTTVSFNGSGTIQAYLMAWEGTKWVSGYSSGKVSYPNTPIASGPGTYFTAPTIVVPATTPGSISFSNNAATGSFSNWKVAYKITGPQSEWTIEDLNTASIAFNEAGSVTAYLIAWDGSNWVSGYPATVSYPNTPLASGPGTALSSPVINVPAMNSGYITFTNSNSFGTFSNWKVAYQFNGSSNWTIEDLNTASIQYSSSGSISAYLIAWDGSKWISGYANTASFPNGPVANGPGTAMSAPTINIPASGNITFTFNTASTNYTNWKIAYQLAGTSNWTLVDLNAASVPLSGSGTITAYLMAWNGSTWVSGYSYSANYSSGPTATGPGTTFIEPLINVPATSSGNITFTNNSSYGSYTNWKVAYQFAGTSGWSIADLATASVPYSGTGSITAYLIAWDGSNWVSGSGNTVPYPKGPVATGPGISMIPPTINVQASNITFFGSTVSYPSYNNWKIVYQWGTTGSWTIADLSATSLPFSGSGTITAYLMAWDGYAWISGNSTTSNYPKGPTPPVASGPGADLAQISLTPPTTVPGSIQFSNPGILGSYTDWKVAYWTTEINQWKIMDYSQASIPVSMSGSVYAYLMAWDPTNNRWLYGRQSATTYPVAIAAPIFRDQTGTQLGLTMESDQTTLSLRMEADGGTIFYTTDGSNPVPGNASTSSFSSTYLNLAFPPETDSVVIKAEAMVASNASPITTLTVFRPGWKLVNSAKPGCIVTDNSITVACGNASGPWLWDSFTSNWVVMASSWTSSEVTHIALTPADIVFTTSGGEVWGLDRTSASPTFWQLGTRVSGSIGGIAVLSDTAWISTSSGPMYYDLDLDTWLSPTGSTLPTSGGAMYSDGNALWMAEGSTLWRYGPSGFRITEGWNNWGSAIGKIYTIGQNPFTTIISTVLGTYKGLQNIDATSAGIPPATLSPNDANGLRGFVSYNNNLFAAYDNDFGVGGVYRANGWFDASQPMNRGWPTSGAAGKAAAHGVSTYTNIDGNWLIASTDYGTYRIKLR